jgi:hypothetical protein
MKPDTLTPKEIFSPNRRLLVPLFQRPYVWKQEEQWEPLWTDITNIADAHLRGDNVKPHFLGAMVFEALDTDTGDEVDKRLIIDGQQRMTTLQIAMEALCDICQQLKQDKHYKLLLKLTRNDAEACDEADEQFKPTTVDQEHFRNVMLCASPDDLFKFYDKPTKQNRVGHPLADCYLYFTEAMTEWLKPSDEGIEKRVESLSVSMRDKLRLVVIDLKEEDDAQVIFETLNARGTPLLPADLVKNFLFHRARREEQDINALYSKYWKAFDEDDKYWRAKLGRGHAQRARIDLFLQNYLTARLHTEVPTSHLYTVFRKFASGRKESTTVQLAALQHYATTYRSFGEQPAGSRPRLFFDRLSAMDMGSAIPCVLELFVTHGDRPDEIIAVLEHIESFLVRRMVCGLNTRGYNRFFVELIKQIPGGPGVATRVRTFLAKANASSNRWPDDDEFREAWVSRPLYDLLVQARLRLLLEALEQALRGAKTEAITIHQTLQIEHLLPRDWKKNWPLPENEDDAQTRLLAENRNHLLHNIGNLTLINGSLNPSISNGPWSAKRPAILEHSALNLNRSLTENWSEETIRSRAQALFGTASKIWPHPGNDHPEPH